MRALSCRAASPSAEFFASVGVTANSLRSRTCVSADAEHQLLDSATADAFGSVHVVKLHWGRCPGKPAIELLIAQFPTRPWRPPSINHGDL